MDNGLSNFENLRVLVLTGNSIKQLPGKMLPRRLVFLECFANDICDLKGMANVDFKELLHFGLGRNKLTDSKFRNILLLLFIV